MAFGSFESGANNQRPMAEINTTPFVDVMLVLLVIFIITAPLFTHAIKLELPKAQSAASAEKPQTITVSIDAQAKLYWNNEPIANEGELNQRFAKAALSRPQPELALRADKQTRYEVIATVMSAAQQAGISKIGFVTEPNLPK
jgi:biopolymer transport protein ExbD